MLRRNRAIPCLLLRNKGLVKTIKFKDPKYLGDPINVVRIFNDKEVDELIILDILATLENRRPRLGYIADIASECFMPLCYGGGIRTLDGVKEMINVGVEKISINSYAVENPSFVAAAAELVGSQSIIVSVDVKKNWRGKYEVFTHRAQKATGLDPIAFIVRMAQLGAGEILLNSIDLDGTMNGYDLELIRRATAAVDIPVIACGGAGSIKDLGRAVKEGGASAVAAGSIFVFQGPLRGVLISFPSPQELEGSLS